MQSTFILTRVHSYITLISTVSNFEYRWRHLRNKNMKHSWISANENFFIFYNVNVKKLNNLYFKSCLITNLADFWNKNTIFKVLYKGLESIVFMYWWNAVVLEIGQYCPFNSSEWPQHWPIHPPQNYCILSIRRGYIVLKSILVLCTPLRIGKYVGG